MKEKNKILNWSLRLCNIILAFNYIAMICLTVVVIGNIINTNFFSNIYVVDGFKSGFGIGEFRYLQAIDERATSLANLSIPMKVWLLLRANLFFYITISAIIIAKKIINSIQSIETFYIDNVRHFKSLAQLGFIASILSAFNIFCQDGISRIHCSIPFGILCFTMACLILSIVFKEGKLLLDDKASII